MTPLDQLISRIGNSHDNQANLRRLTDQLRTQIGVIPFVGAGLSIPFDFPGWSGFLLSLAQSAGIEAQVRRCIGAGEYEEAAEVLLLALNRRAFDDAIEDAFGDHKLRNKQLRGSAASLLPKIATGPAITTNFDHVLEEVFRTAGCPFERVVWGAKAGMATKAFHNNRRFLLKMHGDVDDTTDRILTATEYHNQYGDIEQYGTITASGHDPTPHLPRLLQQWLLSRPLLFIGCGLNQDRILKILRKVITIYPDLAHYAIVERPISDVASRERASFLSSHGIRPIWYPQGQHGLVESILNYLVEQIPAQFRPCQAPEEERRIPSALIAADQSPTVQGYDNARRTARAEAHVRYQLFFHESGQPGVPKAGEPISWYFGICGCVFPLDDYRLLFEPRVDELKRKYFCADDLYETVVLTREGIKEGRGAFARLQDGTVRATFDADLLALLGDSKYHVIIVVLDKRTFFARVGPGGSPRVCCLAELLDRYCAFLVSTLGSGDAVGEARKKHLDRELREGFGVYWAELQRTATSPVPFPLRSREIKLKPKSANIVGMQMASLLAHPAMQGVLRERKLVSELGAFTSQILDRISVKYLDGGRVLIRG